MRCNLISVLLILKLQLLLLLVFFWIVSRLSSILGLEVSRILLLDFIRFLLQVLIKLHVRRLRLRVQLVQALCSVIRLDDILAWDGEGTILHEGITPTHDELLRKLVLLIVPPRIRIHVVFLFEYIILSHFTL